MEKEIKFGTAGIRGIMDEDFDDNLVEVISQAFSNIIEDHIVFVAYDTRRNSKHYAELAAKVLSGNGITAFVMNTACPVPLLSYIIKNSLIKAYGIMITASHNSKEYNGYKVYNDSGAQITESFARCIEYNINSITEINRGNDYEVCDIIKLSSNWINHIKSYIKHIESDLSITYLPLCGCGALYINSILDNYTTVEEYWNLNGEFESCPFPNPENKEVYIPGEKFGSDIILATDPDTDRCGCMVKHDNVYRYLSGNEIGILLTDFMCKMSDKKNIIISNVTTTFIHKLAKYYNRKVIEVPVGFKNIAEKIDDNFLIGFEESCGYLIGDHCKDKDGLLAVYLISEMASYYKNLNMTLVDRLNELYDMLGRIYDKTYKIKSEKKVKETKFYFNNGDRVIIRSSGTEPSIKVYCSSDDEECIENLYNTALKIIDKVL